jgi:hypothetical protein
MTDEDTEANSRWQPMMLVLRGGGRLECKCGALAVIAIGRLNPENEHGDMEEMDYWCQACYLKAQEE